MALLSIIFGVVTAANLALAGHGGTFSYDPKDEYSPTNWGKLSPGCSSRTRQSPIDIKTAQVKYGQDFTIEESCAKQELSGTLVNNGHAPSVSLESGCQLTVNGIFGSATYRLASFHFHFSGTDKAGSEHRINGRKYPAEMHLVHINTKYATLAEALTQSDGLAVVGVLFKKGRLSNPILAEVMDHISDVLEQEQKSTVSVNVLRLIPSLRRVYTYTGSLTTPPCSEVVQWFLTKAKMTVTEDQLAILRQMHTGDLASPPIAKFGNDRPIQRTNTNHVFANF